MIGKQKKLILVALVACVLLGATLFVLFSTVWKPTDAVGEKTEFLVEPLDMALIQEICVKNRSHAWRLYRGEDNELYFEGAERVLYNQNMIAYLRSCTAYLTSLGQVKEPVGMEEYGLTEEACQASFSVTSTTGETYRVLVGDKLLGDRGYYARLDNSEEVHVLGTALERCLFGDLTFFLSGQVALFLSENNYYEMTDFKIRRDGKDFVQIEMIPEDEVTDRDLSTHRVVYPAKYEPNTDLVTRIFKSFVSFVGEGVVAYDMRGKSTEEFTALMQKYNFLSVAGDAMHCEVTYTHSDVTTTVYISRADADGYAYVYSPGFDVIAAFRAENLAWCEYDLMEYTQAEIFATSISNVASIGVFGTDVEATFTLYHGESASDLVVKTERGTVKTQDFRAFYAQLLFVTNDSYANYGEDYKDKQSLKLVIKMTDGAEKTFVFYDIESLKSYYQVDGAGVFCVKRDYVKKLLSDAAKLLADKPVEAVQYA